MKYSKPRLRGFTFKSNSDCMDGSGAEHDFTCSDGFHVGTQCWSGAENASTCVDGTNAYLSCDAGGQNFIFDGCVAGNNPQG